MLSKLILLLGTLIGAFIVWTCIQKNKDFLISPPVTHTTKIVQQTVESQPQHTASSQIVEKTKPIDEAIALKEPLFTYTNTPTEMIQLTAATKDQESNFTNKLEDYCQEPLCTKSLHFQDDVKTATWKNQIFPLIDLIRHNHIQNATLKVEKETITVSGTFAQNAQKETFTHLLSEFQDRGFNIEQNFTILPTPEMAEMPQQEHTKPAVSPSEKTLNNTDALQEASKIDTPPVQPTEKTVSAPLHTPQNTPLKDTQQKQLQKIQSLINNMLKTHPVYFKRNSNKLTLNSKKILNRIINLVNKNAKMITRLRISGHTDASGSAAYNKFLSQKRAEKVRDYLIKQHIKVPVLEAIGYGEERPISRNPYAKENRRVEIEISKEANNE